ncbi:unnamed protein product [Ceutorhynchus assimilis]|uniref:Oxidoreductase-like domain-containing protein n=1 Tax=Ceutorhynchus assimilis TaxID=467358 RepID=A0A9N9QPH3_9CUCU|nr:unnamed protein product [Ceutorhynchus assimilis]
MDPPFKPDEADCCNSGCNPCILDVYEEQLRKFKAANQNAQKSTKKHTKESNLYTFEFIGQEKVIYEPGQYLLLKATVHGEVFQKAYTPIYIENNNNNNNNNNNIYYLQKNYIPNS